MRYTLDCMLYRVGLIGFFLYIIAVNFCFAKSVATNTQEACAHYHPPTPDVLLRVRFVFQQFFLSELLRPQDLAAVGLRYHRDPKAHWLFDDPTHCLGNGHYYFSVAQTNPLLVEAPHQYTDLHTGAILRKLLTHQVRAAAWNNVKRTPESDVTHLPDSYLLAFTKAFLQQFPQGVVVQLHGFSAQKHSLLEQQGSDVVLSEGIHNPDQKLFQLALCLRKTLHTKISVYPIDTHELGATHNQVGRWVNRHYSSRFVHIEMNLLTREKLLQNRAEQQGLISCLNTLT